MVCISLIFPLNSALFAQSKANSAAGKSLAEIPFESANNLIIFNVEINGKGPFRFLLDTGASMHAISPEVARAIGLKVKIDGAVLDSGAKGMVNAGFAQAEKLQVGEFILKKQDFIVAPVLPEYPFQGFLGAELFKTYVVRIDFQKSLLTLTNSKKFNYDRDGTVVPLKLRENFIPQITAEIDGVSGVFKLDTGYNGSLALFGKSG